MNPVTDPVTGITYRSQVDFCRATGVAESTFAARKRRKSVPPELLGYTGNLQKIPAKDHEGRRFDSVSDMARHWGINPRMYLARINRGWDVKKALTAPHFPGSIDITIDGKRFTHVTQLSAYLKIPRSTLFGRLKKGWTAEELVKEPNKAYRRVRT